VSQSQWGNVPAWSYEVAQSLLQSLNAVDPLTYQHCLRVGQLSRFLAKSAGLNEYEQKVAEFSGLFHDIGKMGVPQDIIAKPGKLEAKELDIMKTHPVISEQIVKPLAQNPFFEHLLAPIRGHHERMDGDGYPDKKNGDNIPLIARVILVVDTYDAMSQNRAYRKGLPNEIVYAELKRCSGTQFDPQLVRIFLEAHRFYVPGEMDRETQEKIVQINQYRKAG
jgi:putative nucleotidyltransferase with HDIG domain